MLPAPIASTDKAWSFVPIMPIEETVMARLRERGLIYVVVLQKQIVGPNGPWVHLFGY